MKASLQAVRCHTDLQNSIIFRTTVGQATVGRETKNCGTRKAIVSRWRRKAAVRPKCWGAEGLGTGEFCASFSRQTRRQLAKGTRGRAFFPLYSAIQNSITPF